MKKIILVVLIAMCVCKAKESFAQVSKKDSLALIDFYNSMGGVNTHLQDGGWTTSSPVSTWVGIQLNPHTHRVTVIRIPGGTAYYLMGPIPHSIVNLTELDTLDLRGHGVTGNVPAFLSELHKLIWIELQGCQFTDTIPASLSDNTVIQWLDLSFNQLTGHIPLSFNKFSQFTGLELSHNHLSGNIPTSSTSPPFIDISVNDYNFTSIENYVKKYGTGTGIMYYAEANLTIQQNGKTLSIVAGGTTADNTYQWYKNGILDTTIKGKSSFKTSGTGTYNVVVTNSIVTNLTLNSNTITVSGFEEETKSDETVHSNNIISVYPNPAHSYITVSFVAENNNDNANTILQIMNASGQTIIQKQITTFSGKNTAQMDISKLAAGIYMLLVKMKSGVEMKRFVKD